MIKVQNPDITSRQIEHQRIQKRIETTFGHIARLAPEILTKEQLAKIPEVSVIRSTLSRSWKLKPQDEDDLLSLEDDLILTSKLTNSEQDDLNADDYPNSGSGSNGLDSQWPSLKLNNTTMKPSKSNYTNVLPSVKQKSGVTSNINQKMGAIVNNFKNPSRSVNDTEDKNQSQNPRNMNKAPVLRSEKVPLVERENHVSLDQQYSAKKNTIINSYPGKSLYNSTNKNVKAPPTSSNKQAIMAKKVINTVDYEINTNSQTELVKPLNQKTIPKSNFKSKSSIKSNVSVPQQTIHPTLYQQYEQEYGNEEPAVFFNEESAMPSPIQMYQTGLFPQITYAQAVAMPPNNYNYYGNQSLAMNSSQQQSGKKTQVQNNSKKQTVLKGQVHPNQKVVMLRSGVPVNVMNAPKDFNYGYEAQFQQQQFAQFQQQQFQQQQIQQMQAIMSQPQSYAQQYFY